MVPDKSSFNDPICVTSDGSGGYPFKRPLLRLTRAHFLGLQDFRFKQWCGSEDEDYRRKVAIDKATDKLWKDVIPFRR